MQNIDIVNKNLIIMVVICFFNIVFYVINRVLRTFKKLEKEEELIMKNVKNWKVGESVYNTTKWVTPIDAQFKDY